MAEKFLEISDNLKQLCFDSADYVCLKFILLLNAGAEGNYLSTTFTVNPFHYLILNSQGRYGILTTSSMSKSAANRYVLFKIEHSICV